tara:strand:+ start:51 stop:491 length:441 start_codon:yes stop_codon:yes gene_type:complete
MALLGGGNQWSMPVIGGYVGNITSTYGSWGSYNTSHYRWVLPAAGTYELHASVRVRAWGSTGFTKFRILRASDSHAYGSTDNVKMGFEQNNNATQINCQIHQIWKVTTTSSETFYLQGRAMVTDTSNHSLQSDTNGRPELFWRRLN